MTDFVNWNGKNDQFGRNLLSCRLFRKDNCGFQVEKYLELAPNLTKKLKVSNFQKFLYSFCQLSDRLRGLEC